MGAREIIVEVCVDSLESALAAERGGAGRVELCGSLVEGGVTPSAGLIATTRQKISIGLHVMIRPRAGDFCYTSVEFEVMRRDLLMAKQLGADGVVFGILDQDANVDIGRTRSLVDLAKPLPTTYHRAFDMSADLVRSLEHVAETGADRILTSGGATTAIEGTATFDHHGVRRHQSPERPECASENVGPRDPRRIENPDCNSDALSQQRYLDGAISRQRVPKIRRTGRERCAACTCGWGTPHLDRVADARYLRSRRHYCSGSSGH
jgi:copper homeostasis protein CutC